MDISFRTFLDILLLYTPLFTALQFLDFLFPSLTPNFLSKILRGHIVPHFLRFPLTPHSLFKILRGHIVPHFLSYFLLSLRCLYVFTSLYGESYPRLCVGILLRTFLELLFSYLLLTSFLAPCILKFFPLTSFFDLVFSFYPSPSLYLRFCVSILFRTFLGFGISLSFCISVLGILYLFVFPFSVNYSDSAWASYSALP